MTVFQIIGTIIGTITGLGVFSLGLGYLVAQYKKGGRESNKENEDAKDAALKANTETLELLTAQIKALQVSKVEQDEAFIRYKKDQDDRIAILTGEVRSLKTIIEEKDRKLSEYIKIMQGKDPKLDEAAISMVAFIAEMQAYIRKDVIDTDHIKSVVDRLLGTPKV